MFSKIFIVLIAFIVIVGAVAIFNMGSSVNEPVANVSDDANNDEIDVECDVELIITDVSGFQDNLYDDTYYLMMSVLFTNLPDDLDGYVIKTTYYDESNSHIGQKIDSLSSVVYENENNTDDPLTVGDYLSHKKLNPHHVRVEISKNGNIVTNSTFEIDQNSFEYF